MLPFSSARHEINRDFSLVFQRLELTDLGPYVCQAYSGEGKPVSMHVTLKAVGRVHVRNREDEEYLKYLVSTPEAPTTPRPDPRYPYRPVVKPPRVIPRPEIPIVVEVPQQPSGKYRLHNASHFDLKRKFCIARTLSVSMFAFPIQFDSFFFFF